MKSLRLFLTIVAVGPACAAGSAQMLLHVRSHTHAEPAKEQLVFSAEDKGVRQPVAIPDDVRMVLAKDEYVGSLLEQKKLTAQKLPAAWFSAAQVHLGGHHEEDLVVMGEGPVMGADGTTFWVFAPGRSGYQLALKVATHTLVVKDERTQGLRELEARSAPAAEVFRVSYRYDGVQYKSYKEVSEAVK
jgi:hypothetical protein